MTHAPNPRPGRWLGRVLLATVLVVTVFVIAVRWYSPAGDSNTAAWVRFNAAVHRPNWPVDGAFVLNGLRRDSTGPEVEAWAAKWDNAVLEGEVAMNRNADGSPSVIMRGLRLAVRGKDADFRERIIENLVVRCDRNGRPVSVKVSIALGNGSPSVVREVDVATGHITESRGDLSTLRVKEGAN